MNKKSPDFFSQFVALCMFLGLTVIAIGVFSIKTKTGAKAFSLPGKRNSPPPGSEMPGEYILVGGIVFTAFPTYAILKRMFRSKK